MKSKLHSNLWKYTLLLISKKRIFVAVLGAYYLTIPEVSAADIGLILFAGSAAGFILEIPSGFVSDKLGHKQALIVSQLLILFSSILFLVASNLALLILATILLQAGIAFHSGTGSAFMHETLKALGREKDYSSVMGKMSSLGFGVPIILMVLIPFLVQIDFKLPFLIATVLDILGFLPALFLTIPPSTPEGVKEINATNFTQVIQQGRKLGFFPYAIFSALLAGILFAVSGFRAPYQTVLEIPIIWFGVFFGLGRVLASLLLAYSGKLRLLGSVFRFYKFEIIVYPVLLISLGALANPWVVVVAFLLINGLQWGLSRLDESYLMDIIHEHHFKATLLSTRAQIEHIFAAVISVGLGLAIQYFSYQIGFLLMLAIFVCSAIPLYIYIRRSQWYTTSI